MTTVDFDVPSEIAFDFLVDPRNRPLWQSSLRRVEGVSPAEPAVGQTWIDVTAPGMRPAMVTTELVRPHAWTEVGTWRSIKAELGLTFTDRPGGCVVGYRMTLAASGPFRWPTAVLGRLAPYAIASDLKRASEILSERASGK